MTDDLRFVELVDHYDTEIRLGTALEMAGLKSRQPDLLLLAHEFGGEARPHAVTTVATSFHAFGHAERYNQSSRERAKVAQEAILPTISFTASMPRANFAIPSIRLIVPGC